MSGDELRRPAEMWEVRMVNGEPILNRSPLSQEEPVAFAWTAMSGYRLYPPYVNLTGNRLTVRAMEVEKKCGPMPGVHASVDLPPEALDELRQALARPTPRIGEDELVEISDRLTDTACALRSKRMLDHASRCASAAVALSQAADRLILYREALNDIAWDASFQSTGDKSFAYIIETARAALRSSG